MGYAAMHEAIKNGAPSKAALREGNKTKLVGTIEFFPQEGKYHYDGHRLCKVSWHPKETKEHSGICSVCGRRVTVGVVSRVNDLSNREDGAKPAGAPEFKSFVPLEEIIASCFGVGTASKKVSELYEKLLKSFGNEFEILLNTDTTEVAQESLPIIGEGLKRIREGKLHIEPGYDGEFGKVEIFSEDERKIFLSGNQGSAVQDKLF